MLTRDEMMQSTAQAQLGTTSQTLLDQLATFEARYPCVYSAIADVLYAKTDLNLGDLLSILTCLSDFQ